MLKISTFKERLYRKLVFKIANINRILLSANYIEGEGIEIGALNYPLVLKPGVKVKYLDRVSPDDHMAILDEFKRDEIVNVEIIDDGETMKTVANDSQDFVIANHFLEHCQNPILAIENMLRVVKLGGVLFLAIPDKRYTFDTNRALTTIDHLLKDYKEGPSWSEESHYYDFVKYTEHGFGKTEVEIREVIQALKKKNFSIHFHVWDHQSILEMFCALKSELKFKFQIEAVYAARKGGNESIFILRKGE